MYLWGERTRLINSKLVIDMCITAEGPFQARHCRRSHPNVHMDPSPERHSATEPATRHPPLGIYPDLYDPDNLLAGIAACTICLLLPVLAITARLYGRKFIPRNFNLNNCRWSFRLECRSIDRQHGGQGALIVTLVNQYHGEGWGGGCKLN